MTLIYLTGVIICCFFMARVYRWNQKRQLRSQGIYPQAGQASMADVERLVKMGHRIEAIVCYRELFPHAGLAEAKEAVDALAR